MINHELNEYGYIEGTEFEGLMPAAMEILGDENCVGLTDEMPTVSVLGKKAKGFDPMEVISTYDVMMNE